MAKNNTDHNRGENGGGIEEYFYIFALLYSAGLLSLMVVLIALFKKSTKQNHKNSTHGSPSFNSHLVLTSLSIFIYIYDLGSDIVLSYFWCKNEMDVSCLLSALFTFGPTIPMFIANIYLVFNHTSFGISCKSVMFVITAPLAQLVLMFKSITVGARTSEKEGITRYISMVTLVEATFESAPQIILQVYVNANTNSNEDIALTIVRFVSFGGSVLGLAKAMYLFKHNVEKQNEPNLTTKTKIISFLSRMFEIVPRLVLLSLFAIALKSFLFYFILFRYLLCVGIAIVAFVWKSTESLCEDILMLILGSFANIFFFCKYKYFDPDISNDKKTKLTILYYVLFHAENIGLFTAWIVCNDRQYEWYYNGSIVLFVVGLISHPISLCIYSKFGKKERQQDLDKPDNGKKSTSNNRI